MSRIKKIAVVFFTAFILVLNIIPISSLAENYSSSNCPIAPLTPSDDAFTEITDEYVSELGGGNFEGVDNYKYKATVCTFNRTNTTIEQYYYTFYSHSEIVFYFTGTYYYALSNTAMYGIREQYTWSDYAVTTSSPYCSYEANLPPQGKECLISSYPDKSITEIHFNSNFVFDSKANAQTYLDSGVKSGIIQEPYEPEIVENTTQGFNQFQVRRINDKSIAGGTGALVTYEFPSGTYKALENQFIVYELTYSYAMTQHSGSLSNKLDDSYYKEYETYTFIVKDVLKGDYGQRTFDFVELCETYQGYTKDDVAWAILCMNSACLENNIFFTWGSNFLGTFLEPFGFSADIFDTNLYYNVDEMEVNISAYLLEDYVKSKSSYGYVDLVTGQNQSMAIQGDSVEEGGTVTEGETVTNENLKDVEKQLNPDGSVGYVEVDVNVNVDGSGGGAGSVVQNNNVTIPDEITVNLNGYWSDSGGSGDNITIEDDDYSSDALKNVIDGAYGVFDNLSTEKNDDGFLALLSGFLGALNPDLGGMISFGMGSVIVISILRSLINR